MVSIPAVVLAKISTDFNIPYLLWRCCYIFLYHIWECLGQLLSETISERLSLIQNLSWVINLLLLSRQCPLDIDILARRRHSSRHRDVELSQLSTDWIAQFPFRKYTVYRSPLPSIIYNVSVWRARLNCLKYVSLLWDKHCHLSLEGMEEVTRWQTATFSWVEWVGGGLRRVRSRWSTLSCRSFDNGKQTNV